MTHTHARTARTGFSATIFLMAITVAFAAFGTSSALAITRDQVLARAQVRVDRPVAYSQAKYYNGYRTDCSGYVSYCWATGTSWATSSFHNVTHRIAASQLAPGDALLKPGYHIRLFYGWVDASHTQYVAYEAGSSLVAVCRVHSLADDLAYGFYPARYNRISGSPASRNLLKNGAFNTWARSWGSQPEQPVWWQTNAPYWQQTGVISRRKDIYHTSVNALALLNSSTDPGSVSELSQSAPVVANAPYRLSAWVRTASDPRGLALRLEYFNAAGVSVASTSTTGDACGVGGSAWRMMSVLMTTPPDAVSATVSLQLAGGTTTNTAGVAVAGTSALVDDVWLQRPQVTVSIKANRTVAYNGQVAYFSGSVAPSSAIGVPALFYVMKPGTTTWVLVSNAPVYSASGVGGWKRSYTFTSSMRRGVWRFRCVVANSPGWLGAASSTVSVTLK